MKKLFILIFGAAMLFSAGAFARENSAWEEEARPVIINFQEPMEGTMPNLRIDGIAYVPLNDYNCALMGLGVTESERALTVDKVQEGEYLTVPENTASKEDGGEVKIVDKFVVVNGRFHDNPAMKYPFVSFCGTYYMPLYRQYIVQDLEWEMTATSDEIQIFADNRFFVSDGENDLTLEPTGDYFIVQDKNCVKIHVDKNRFNRTQTLYLYDGKDFTAFASNIFNEYSPQEATIEGNVLKIGARCENNLGTERYTLGVNLEQREIEDIVYEGTSERDIPLFDTDGKGNYLKDIKAKYAFYDGGHVSVNGTLMRSYSVSVTEEGENGEEESPYWIMCEDLENYGYDVLCDVEGRRTIINRNKYRKVEPLDFDGTDEHLPVYDSDWKIVVDGKEVKKVFNIGGRTLIYAGELGQTTEEEIDENYFVMNVSTDKTAKKETIKNRVVAYYSVDVFDEPVSDLQTQYLTDVIYAFVIPRSDATLFVPRPETLKEVVEKAHKDNCRVMVSLGGGANAAGENVLKNFEDIASDPELMRKFKENCVWMVREYGLDGIEVDWESPTNATRDKYESFMLELCNDERFESVSIAVSGSDVYPNSNVQAVPDSVIEGVDFMNIMAYGIYGEDHSPYSYAVTSLDYWLTRTDKKEKLILGLPLFSLPGYEQYRHLALQGKDILHSDYIEDLGIYINSRDMLVKKAVLAKEKGGGVMFFDIHEDTTDSTSAAKAVYEVMQNRR